MAHTRDTKSLVKPRFLLAHIFGSAALFFLSKPPLLAGVGRFGRSALLWHYAGATNKLRQLQQGGSFVHILTTTMLAFDNDFARGRNAMIGFVQQRCFIVLR